MSPVNVYIRFSGLNRVLDKMATLTLDENLVYQDEGGDFKGNIATTSKFSLLTIASPLIGLARLVRSVAFVCVGDFDRAGRELVGGVLSPVVSAGCFLGSFLASVVYVISSGDISFYIQMRRTYAFFEAWVNRIDLQSSDLVSYSKRVSLPADCVGKSNEIHKNVWTTAPCMQPVLEKGTSCEGGLLDVERMKKIFPLIKMSNILYENGEIVVQSEYLDKNVRYVVCNGACERARVSQTCCCCFRIDAAFDRFLCLEFGQGNCSSMFNSSDFCGLTFCTICGIGVCCLHAQVDDVQMSNAGCVLSFF